MAISPKNTSFNTTIQTTTSTNQCVGDFIIGPKLGEGTFSKVCQGTHKTTNEKVAIKIMLKTQIKDKSDMLRIEKEINIQKKLHHNNLIQQYCILETTTKYYIVTEYCSGGELFNYIVSKRKLTENEACRIFQQLIAGLEYLHKMRIVHRDLKPENLLFDSKRDLKIADYGLSSEYNGRLTTRCGSPCYAAPEMVSGRQYNGMCVDIWSAGVVLFTMVCGFLPFEDDNQEILFGKIRKGIFTLPTHLSIQCKDLLKSIMVTDPNLRYNFEQIKHHNWFMMSNTVMGKNIFFTSPGLFIKEDVIPIDEELLKEMVNGYRYDLKEVVGNIIMNKHCEITTAYYLLIKKKVRNGGKSVSDFSSRSELFLDYIRKHSSKLSYFSYDHTSVINYYMRFYEEKINPPGPGTESSCYTHNNPIAANDTGTIEYDGGSNNKLTTMPMTITTKQNQNCYYNTTVGNCHTKRHSTDDNNEDATSSKKKKGNLISFPFDKFINKRSSNNTSNTITNNNTKSIPNNESITTLQEPMNYINMLVYPPPQHNHRNYRCRSQENENNRTISTTTDNNHKRILPSHHSPNILIYSNPYARRANDKNRDRDRDKDRDNSFDIANIKKTISTDRPEYNIATPYQKKNKYLNTSVIKDLRSNSPIGTGNNSYLQNKIEKVYHQRSPLHCNNPKTKLKQFANHAKVKHYSQDKSKIKEIEMAYLRNVGHSLGDKNIPLTINTIDHHHHLNIVPLKIKNRAIDFFNENNPSQEVFCTTSRINRFNYHPTTNIKKNHTRLKELQLKKFINIASKISSTTTNKKSTSVEMKNKGNNSYILPKDKENASYNNNNQRDKSFTARDNNNAALSKERQNDIVTSHNKSNLSVCCRRTIEDIQEIIAGLLGKQTVLATMNVSNSN